MTTRRDFLKAGVAAPIALSEVRVFLGGRGAEGLSGSNRNSKPVKPLSGIESEMANIIAAKVSEKIDEMLRENHSQITDHLLSDSQLTIEIPISFE